MSATATNRTASAVLVQTLLTIVKALKLADNQTPAFGAVALFDQESLVEAFKWLAITDQRVCVIVPLDEQFEEKAGHGTKLVITRMLPVALLISDRVLGDRVSALYGNATAQPPVIGAYGLYELVLPAVTGQIVAGPAKAVATPQVASLFVVKEKQQTNLPGRSALALELHIRGGVLEANIGPGPVI